MKTIDLRSDTVTRPCEAMRAAMASAEVGDDVYGEDPTVNALEAYAASLLGKEAALFCTSGTQSNLTAILAHCERGDEYIVGQQAHTYLYEGGGAAVLGSVQPQPIVYETPGVMSVDSIRAAIKPDDCHFARSRLVCLENTHFGYCLPLDYPAAVREVCDEHGLALHMDGARLFNAAASSGRSAAELARSCDTVSICLSKGLGAPMGSVLCGSAELVGRARRWRKLLGGALRQVGIVAAAGRFALEHNRERLRDDHDNAARLSEALRGIDGVTLWPGSAETNMVFVSVAADRREDLIAAASRRQVILPDDEVMRLVTHLDVSADDVDAVVDLFRSVC